MLVMTSVVFLKSLAAVIQPLPMELAQRPPLLPLSMNVCRARCCVALSQRVLGNATNGICRRMRSQLVPNIIDNESKLPWMLNWHGLPASVRNLNGRRSQGKQFVDEHVFE